ncbi:tyrosine phosphatase family-domain-containing protein [Cristinia sonorae]|uniref:Tyrosine phosphatase family-domain-containing protein n=1 Tax=Cristinia sonorae TaxID=1940300 RepID=A0A8K0UX99_9AGAR|nr:tyrosine phosphatase family-domain-containing protein [Cristinia sonorae]
MEQITQNPSDETILKIINTPPFLLVDGIANLRDTGSYSNGDGTIVKPGYLYRSADPSSITEKGKEQFRELGIKKVFDFRIPAEIRRARIVVEGVEVVDVSAVKVPIWSDDVEIAKELQLFAEDEAEAFRITYRGMLLNRGSAFGIIFRHLRDHPEEPCLIHCAVGKDRTGIAVALFLKLLGVSDEDIAKDYALTTPGLAPILPILTAKAQSVPVFRENWDGVVNMGKSPPQAMHDLLKMLDEEFGGVEEYLKTYAGLMDDDLVLLRRNFTVPSSQG